MDKKKDAKPFSNWEKISRKDLPAEKELPSTLFEKKVKNFDLERLEKIDTKQDRVREGERFARKISKIDEVYKPKICKLCGREITKEFFWAFLPKETLVCRGCLQGRRRCSHCGLMVTSKSVRNFGEVFCDACRIKKKCCSSEEIISSIDEGGRIENETGYFLKQAITTMPRCSFCENHAWKKHSEKARMMVCLFCFEALIHTEKEVQELHLEIHSFLRRKHPAHFRLASKLFFADKTFDFNKQSKALNVSLPTPKIFLIENFLKHYYYDVLLNHKKNLDEKNVAIAFLYFLQFTFYSEKGFYFESTRLKKEALKDQKSSSIFLKFYKQIETKGLTQAYVSFFKEMWSQL